MAAWTLSGCGASGARAPEADSRPARISATAPAQFNDEFGLMRGMLEWKPGQLERFEAQLAARERRKQEWLTTPGGRRITELRAERKAARSRGDSEAVARATAAILELEPIEEQWRVEERLKIMRLLDRDQLLEWAAAMGWIKFMTFERYRMVGLTPEQDAQARAIVRDWVAPQLTPEQIEEDPFLEFINAGISAFHRRIEAEVLTPEQRHRLAGR